MKNIRIEQIEQIEELIDINNKILNLTDKQIESVFLTEGKAEVQKHYTHGMIDGLEAALSDDEDELNSSIKSLRHLLKRKNLLFNEALDLEAAEGKPVVAIGAKTLMKLDFSEESID